MKHTIFFRTTFLWLLTIGCSFSLPGAHGQSVEIDADLRVSGGLNFAGFSTYNADTFTVDLPGIAIVDGQIPKGTMISFISSAHNTGDTHLSIDNGTEVTTPNPVVKRGAVQLQTNDIVFGEIVLVIFDSTCYQLLRGVDIPNYLVDCNGQLYNLQTSESHCGSCGNACPAGHLCVDGNCVLSCQAGFTDCSGVCVDLANDRLNCGSCGLSCPPGQVCDGGSCVVSCQAGLTNCSGTCVNTQTDEMHCGGCNINCPPGHICNGSTCVLSCQIGLTNCSGTCVNTQTDEMHCGGCNISCPPGHRCDGSNCVLSCQAGLTNCSGTCVNTQTDEMHCGDCGISCPSGQICVNGMCQDP